MGFSTHNAAARKAPSFPRHTIADPRLDGLLLEGLLRKETQKPVSELSPRDASTRPAPSCGQDSVGRGIPPFAMPQGVPWNTEGCEHRRFPMLGERACATKEIQWLVEGEESKEYGLLRIKRKMPLLPEVRCFLPHTNHIHLPVSGIYSGPGTSGSNTPPSTTSLGFGGLIASPRPKISWHTEQLVHSC